MPGSRSLFIARTSLPGTHACPTPPGTPLSDAYPGQSGSPAWTTDLNVRGVLSCTGGGYTYFRGLTDGAISWILKNRV